MSQPDKTIYLTTAIDYTNAKPHIGHAYEKILTDVMARHHRQAGRRVYFLTGVDQHGQKVQITAKAEGKAPAEFVSEITALFKQLWVRLEVQYDGWAETTDARHIRVVKEVLQKMCDQGDLYLSAQKGFYSIRAEQFVTDKERLPDGTFGEEWGKVVELEEENWYFRLSKYVPWLREFLKAHPETVQPAFRLNDVLNALEKSGDMDLCVSRPKERLEWGIPFPFADQFVTYVWFDALLNYITFAGYLKEEGDTTLPEFKTLWPCDAHVIGKDILVPAHAIYWLTMLHAMGFSDQEIPKLMVHGWWNIGGRKMSKTLGNVIDPHNLADIFTVDGLRHYLMRDISTGYDADFKLSRILLTYNQHLANELGNLLNRLMNMTRRYRDGVVQNVAFDHASLSQLRETAEGILPDYLKAMDDWQIHQGLEAVWKLVNQTNLFIEQTAPFKLAKDPEQAEYLDAVLYHGVEALAFIATLIAPVMPSAAQRMRVQLNLGESPFPYEALKWPLLAGPGETHRLGEPAPLFPRLEYTIQTGEGDSQQEELVPLSTGK